MGNEHDPSEYVVDRGASKSCPVWLIGTSRARNWFLFAGCSCTI